MNFYEKLSYDRVNIFDLNNSHVVVASMDENYIHSLSKYFTNDVKGARFSPAVRSGNWDGKIRFLRNDGTLPRGLLPECIARLKELEIPYEMDESLEEKKIDVSNFENIIRSELLSKQTDKVFEPWENQWNTAKKLIANKRGISRSATSSGKSLTITMMVKFLLHCHYIKKALIVVPRVDLIVQLEKDAEEFGFNRKDIGLYLGKIKDCDKPLVISTWQTLQNIQESSFFEQFECLILDECFAGNNLVDTEDGKKKIKDIKEGDMIYSFNEKNKQKELKQVKKTYKNRTVSKKMIKIVLENDKIIKCTPNHLIYTQNRGWIQAKELKECDLLVKL